MAIFNSYVSLPEGITFLNTSKRWNMKRSNWLKPEFSAGLLLLDAIWLLFDCCFSPLNNIEMRGNWDHDDHGLHLSEQWCSYDSLVFTAHGWYGMQPLSSRLGFIWTMQCFFSFFFCPGVEERSCTLHGSFDINVYIPIYFQPAAAPQQTFWHVLGHHNASLTCLLFREILCETMSPMAHCNEKGSSN